MIKEKVFLKEKPCFKFFPALQSKMDTFDTWSIN